jgi:SAM-dependent methyltransferase
MEQRDTFDAVAGLYGEARPGYPAAVYDDLWALADLGPDAAVLEVGCGAGQATGDLAARAGRVLAIDPGPNLIAEARARVASDKVAYEVGRFEAFAPQAGAYDLVASAQAWHWVDPAAAFAKAALALRSGGSLAVWGHVQEAPVGPAASPFRSVFDRFLPGVWGTPSGAAAYYKPDGLLAPQFAASEVFDPMVHRAYAWTWRVDPQTLGRYLRTDSSYHLLPEAQRFAMFDALSEVVAENGGVLEWPWETHLYVARRR